MFGPEAPDWEDAVYGGPMVPDLKFVPQDKTDSGRYWISIQLIGILEKLFQEIKNMEGRTILGRDQSVVADEGLERIKLWNKNG